MTSPVGDTWIEETSRPYVFSIQEMTEARDARKFHVDHQGVENAVAKIMLAMGDETPDTFMLAVSIIFINIVWIFKLRLCSLLHFAESFLANGDRKPTIWALRQWLNDDYERTVTRYDTVKLSVPQNLTKLMTGPKYQEPEKRFY